MHEEGGSDGDENDMAVCLPTTNAGDFAYQIYRRKAELCGVPSQVIMNQVGNLCNRYNHRIMGTNLEQNFIQRIVSQQCGTSHPLLYPCLHFFQVIFTRKRNMILVQFWAMYQSAVILVTRIHLDFLLSWNVDVHLRLVPARQRVPAPLCWHMCRMF
jgi:hypothetical protein